MRSSLRSLLAVTLALGTSAVALSCNQDGTEPVSSVQSLSTACRAPSPSAAFHVTNAFPDVSVDRPTQIVSAGGGVYYVTEQSGTVKRIAKDGDRFVSSIILDITSDLYNTGEMGLLGIALSPDFATTGEFFLTYTRKHHNGRTAIAQTVLARYVAKGGKTVDRAASEEIMLTLERDVPNHNGGRPHFGADRMLYVSIGDGSWGDPAHRVQDNYQLFGKMLRLDVLGKHPYAIPADNPFANGGGRGEVWAKGFRNPWTWSFDRFGKIWLGDVGNNRYEEIDVVTKGGNYGWPIREGRHCLFAAPCDVPGATEPIFEYPHVDGFAVTAGYLYRGKKLGPALVDQLVYSDFMTGRVWALDPNAPQTSRLLFDSGLFVSNFGEDEDGELLMLDFGGRVMRIEASGAVADPGPITLRDLGCLDGTTNDVAKGFLPYDVISPLWSDGLEKRRFVSVPDATKIHIRQDGSWDPPAGTMFLKDFAHDGKHIETRMLVHDAESGWLGYTFAWNDEQTNATLLTDAKDVPLDGGTWTIPSRAQCLTCHSANAGNVLGFTFPQTNHDILVKGVATNQVSRLEAMSLLDQTPDVVMTPPYPDPAGSDGTPESRARTYLDTNCSTCHRPAIGAGGVLDMRSSTPTDMMNVVCIPPAIDDLGIANAMILAPGAPERSVLYQRMATTGELRMPRIGSHKVDATGLAIVREWIMALPPCK